MNESDEEVLPERDALLVEYQAAQDSAQHHDQLVWSITSILWASSLILFGLVLTAMGQPGLEWPLTSTAILAIILTIYLWRCVRQLRAIKVQKYRRCVKIERELRMKQHSGLQYPSGSQTAGYSLVMTVFLLLWLVLIVFIWALPNDRNSKAVTGPVAIDETPLAN
jgi:hypothetical protein